jgi:asparagine synthase (glutamine-hydrolysing)
MKNGEFDLAKSMSNEEWINWALEHDLNNYLVSDVLALSDKASMQHGVELRVPYLSEELVNYLKNGQAEYLLKNGRKSLLKELLIKYGGKEFAARPKEGFGLPLSHWLMDKRINHLWEFKDNSNHLIFEFLNKDLLNALLLQQRQKKADHGPLLWSILVLAHWLNHHFE